MARVVQMSTLPATMPSLAGLRRLRHVPARPTSPAATPSTSPLLEQGLLVVLGDATGHGIAPALSVTQMQAMLRMAFRLGADLETAFTPGQQPARRARWPATASSPRSSGCSTRPRTGCASTAAGRGRSCTSRRPARECTRHKPTSFPLGAMPPGRVAPGGEPRDAAGRHPACSSPTASSNTTTRRGEQFGEDARRAHRAPTHHAAQHGRARRRTCSTRCSDFAQGAPQEDDMTDRAGQARGRRVSARADFPRSIDALHEMFAFTARGVRQREHRRRAAADRGFRAGGALHQHGQIRPTARRRCASRWPRSTAASR